MNMKRESLSKNESLYVIHQPSIVHRERDKKSLSKVFMPYDDLSIISVL